MNDTPTIGMWVHWAAIVLFCGAPIYGLIAPHTGIGQGALGLLLCLIALGIAEVSAGLFDGLLAVYYEATGLGPPA